MIETDEQPCQDCGETHTPLSVDNLEKLHKQLNRRYWTFSTGFVTCALGAAVALGSYNYSLGIACFLAEASYLFYVNMFYAGSARARIKETQYYLKHGVAATQNVETPKPTHGGGQYI